MHKQKHKINENKQVNEITLIRMQQLKYITQFHDIFFWKFQRRKHNALKITGTVK